MEMKIYIEKRITEIYHNLVIKYFGMKTTTINMNA